MLFGILEILFIKKGLIVICTSLIFGLFKRIFRASDLFIQAIEFLKLFIYQLSSLRKLWIKNTSTCAVAFSVNGLLVW